MKSLYDVFSCKTSITKSQLEDYTSFLTRQQNRVLIPNDVGRKMLASKSSIQTPISQIATRIVDNNKGNIFCFITLPSDITDMPEIVTYPHICFDAKQIAAKSKINETILRVSPFFNKIILNVTSHVNRSREVVNISTFQAMIVRDALVRSYFNAQPGSMWLGPSARLLVKVYSMSLGRSVAQMFNFNLFEEKLVSIVFAYYFSLLMIGNPTMTRNFLLSNGLYFGYPDLTEVRTIMDKCDTKLDPFSKELNFDDACLICNDLGIPRLNLSRHFLYTKVKAWGTDSLTSFIALEYPPYWAYIVLLSLSGAKIGMTYNIRNKTNLEKDAKQFSEDLLNNSVFIPMLN